MKQRLFSVLVAIGMAALPSAAAIQQPVKVASGQISGTPASDPSIAVFKGIPYAAPPVGDLRWRAPEAPAAWKAFAKAINFPPVASRT